MDRTRRVWFWVIVCLIVVLILAGAFWLDPIVRNWMAQHPNRHLRIVMAQVSRFGDWPEHVALGLLLLGFAQWRGNKKWTRIFLAMLIACALAGVSARVIKITTGRARPSVTTESAWTGLRMSEKYHAFPSGHTAAATAFFAVLVLTSWRIGIGCLLFPLLIAFSRMYVAAHYLSDVVFAALLGVVCAVVAVRMMKLANTAGSGD